METGCLARVLSLLHAADRQTDKQLVLSQCGPNRTDVWAASTCRSRLAFIVNSQWAYSETTFICLPALPLHYFVLALKYCQGQSCTPCSTPTNSREHVTRKIYMCAVKLQAATFFHPPKMVKPTVIAQNFLWLTLCKATLIVLYCCRKICHRYCQSWSARIDTHFITS